MISSLTARCFRPNGFSGTVGVSMPVPITTLFRSGIVVPCSRLHGLPLEKHDLLFDGAWRQSAGLSHQPADPSFNKRRHGGPRSHAGVPAVARMRQRRWPRKLASTRHVQGRCVLPMVRYQADVAAIPRAMPKHVVQCGTDRRGHAKTCERASASGCTSSTAPARHPDGSGARSGARRLRSGSVILARASHHGFSHGPAAVAAGHLANAGHQAQINHGPRGCRHDQSA